MKIDIIINSQAGRTGRMDIKSLLGEKFREHEYRLLYTEHAGHAADLARDASERGCDILVACGGDGTVNEVVNGSWGAEIPIGIIPAGTANDLASRLGIPGDPDAACDIILARQLSRLHAVRVNRSHFLTTCGLGFPAASIAATHILSRDIIFAQLVRQLLGQQTYLFGVAVAFLRKRPEFSIRISCNGKATTLRAISLIIGIQPVLGGRFLVLPDADSTDGMLNCYIIGCCSRFLLLKHILATRRGTQANLPEAAFMNGGHFVLETTPPAIIFGDGEIRESASRFDIRIVPRAVPIIVPARWRSRP